MNDYDLRQEREVVENYLRNLYLEARQKVLKEMNGLGCGCLNCKRRAAYALTQAELSLVQLPQGSQEWYVDQYGYFQFVDHTLGKIIRVKKRTEEEKSNPDSDKLDSYDYEDPNPPEEV